MRLLLASCAFVLSLVVVGYAQDTASPKNEHPPATASDVELFREEDGRVTGGLISDINVEIKPSKQTQDLSINARITDMLPYNDPRIVTLGFRSKPCLSDRYDYLTLWIDGARYDAGLLEAQFCAGGLGRLREFRTVEIPYPVFVKLAHAKQVNISIGDERFSLVQPHLDAFRELIRKVVLDRK